MLTLPDLIERQARARPKAPALVFNGAVTSYGELHQKIAQWATALAVRGIKAGDSFGLVMRNSPEFVITFFALVRLGARALPVNFLLKADEIAYIFQDAGVVGVLTQPSFLGNVLEARKKLPQLRDVVVTGQGRVTRDEGREDNAETKVLYFDDLISATTSLIAPPASPDPDEIALTIH